MRNSGPSAACWPRFGGRVQVRIDQQNLQKHKNLADHGVTVRTGVPPTHLQNPDNLVWRRLVPQRPASHKIGISGMSAKSDAVREPGFRQNRCVSHKFRFGSFIVGLALKVPEICLPDTQLSKRNPGSRTAPGLAGTPNMPLLRYPGPGLIFFARF